MTGIGRRAALRMRCPKGRAGSTPVSGIMFRRRQKKSDGFPKSGINVPMPNVPYPRDALLTFQEACDKLGLSEEVLKRLVSEGEFRMVRGVDTTMMFYASEICEYAPEKAQQILKAALCPHCGRLLK